MFIGPFAQGFPQNGNVTGEPSLFHNRVTPHLRQEFVLAEDPSAVLDKDKKSFQYFWSKRDELALAVQKSLVRIHDKAAEFVTTANLFIHKVGTFQKKDEALPKD